MSPVEFAVIVGVFISTLMTIMIGMFFFSISYKGKDKKTASFEPLLEKYLGFYQELTLGERIPMERETLLEESKKAAKSGALIKARHLAIVAGDLEGDPDYSPPQLREVLLPDIIRINKHISPEIFSKTIAHPLIHSPLTPLFASISRPLLEVVSLPPVKYGIKLETKASNHVSMEAILGYFSTVSKIVLNFEPDLYLFGEDLLVHANTSRIGRWFPSVLVGKQFLQLSENDQLFKLASKLALCRPELRILMLYPTIEKFEQFVGEIISYQEGNKTDFIENILERLDSSEVEMVKDTIIKMGEMDLFEFLEWRRGAILTARRVGWVLVDRWKDIRLLLEKEGNEESINDLLEYMISDRFIDSYKLLGVIPSE
jgi:hypothetical protein